LGTKVAREVSKKKKFTGKGPGGEEILLKLLAKNLSEGLTGSGRKTKGRNQISSLQLGINIKSFWTEHEPARGEGGQNQS